MCQSVSPAIVSGMMERVRCHSTALCGECGTLFVQHPFLVLLASEEKSIDSSIEDRTNFYEISTEKIRSNFHDC